jgi:hypothetical protein
MYDLESAPVQNYSEIGQSILMKFAFAQVNGKKIKQMHHWVKCRDFLGDALYSQAQGKPYQIYGFCFDPTKHKIPTNKTYLLIKYPDIDKIKKFLPSINEMEKKVRWAQSKIFQVKGKEDVVLAVSSGKWVSSSQFISLYTMLWRLSSIGRDEKESLEDFFNRCSKLPMNDGQYLKAIAETKSSLNIDVHPFFLLMKHNQKVFKNAYEGEGPTHWVHNNNGIKSFMCYANIAEGNSNDKNFGRKQALIFRNLVMEK